MKIKKFFIICTILLISFCLAGCKQTYNVHINNDNTVSFSIKHVIDKDTFNMLQSFNVDLQELENNKMMGMSSELDSTNALFQETAAFFYNRGYTITPLEDSVELGFEANKNFMNIQEFNEEIKRIYELGFSGLYLEVTNEKTKTTNTYTAYGTLEYLMDSDIDVENDSIKSAIENQFDLGSLETEVYIYMPTTVPVTATDGDQTVVSGSIYWKANHGQNAPTEVHAYSTYKDSTFFYVGIAVFVVVVIMAGIVVSRILKRKKEKQNSARNDESFRSEE